MKGPTTNMRRTIVIFALGVAVALTAGWVAFPRALYVQKHQPLDFRHKTHAEKSGVVDCNECHALRDDGAFAGVPAMEKCAGCHSERIGTSSAEAILVDTYIKPAHETPWLIYSQQPANVWFSHAIHLKRAGLTCTECHSTYGESDQVKVYEVNRISGYSRDIWGRSISRLRRAPHEGMKMSDCESCHRKHQVEVGCLGCHQ